MITCLEFINEFSSSSRIFLCSHAKAILANCNFMGQNHQWLSQASKNSWRLSRHWVPQPPILQPLLSQAIKSLLTPYHHTCWCTYARDNVFRSSCTSMNSLPSFEPHLKIDFFVFCDISSSSKHKKEQNRIKNYAFLLQLHVHSKNNQKQRGFSYTGCPYLWIGNSMTSIIHNRNIWEKQWACIGMLLVPRIIS